MLAGTKESTKNPELVLWRSVINQAFLDATALLPEGYVIPAPTPRKPGRRGITQPVAVMRRNVKANHYRAVVRERKKARQWLLNNSEDFRTVCNLAQLEPDAIIDAARRLEAKEWQLTERVDGMPCFA